MSNAGPSITAVIVPDSARRSLLPRMFGTRHMIRGESLVYGWMQRLCTAYQGDFWEFFDLQGSAVQGAGFMVPRLAGPVEVVVEGNGFHGLMSAEAAGIVAKLFALSRLANATELNEHIERHHALLDFARRHP